MSSAVARAHQRGPGRGGAESGVTTLPATPLLVILLVVVPLVVAPLVDETLVDETLVVELNVAKVRPTRGPTRDQAEGGAVGSDAGTGAVADAPGTVIGATGTAGAGY